MSDLEAPRTAAGRALKPWTRTGEEQLRKRMAEWKHGDEWLAALDEALAEAAAPADALLVALLKEAENLEGTVEQEFGVGKPVPNPILEAARAYLREKGLA